jgi:hypothetical protein
MPHASPIQKPSKRIYTIVINARTLRIVNNHLTVPFFPINPNKAPSDGNKHIEIIAILPNDPKEAPLTNKENKMVNIPRQILEIKVLYFIFSSSNGPYIISYIFQGYTSH